MNLITPYGQKLVNLFIFDDGKYDIAIFNAGPIVAPTGFTQRPWGSAGDVAIPRAYLPQ
jgi:hypothetical protein